MESSQNNQIETKQSESIHQSEPKQDDSAIENFKKQEIEVAQSLDSRVQQTSNVSLSTINNAQQSSNTIPQGPSLPKNSFLNAVKPSSFTVDASKTLPMDKIMYYVEHPEVQPDMRVKNLVKLIRTMKQEENGEEIEEDSLDMFYKDSEDDENETNQNEEDSQISEEDEPIEKVERYYSVKEDKEEKKYPLQEDYTITRISPRGGGIQFPNMYFSESFLREIKLAFVEYKGFYKILKVVTDRETYKFKLPNGIDTDRLLSMINERNH
jgi:hypothetical protein